MVNMRLLAISACLPLPALAASTSSTATPSATVTLTPAESSAAVALAAQIPQCAQSCDQKAVAAAGCQPTEFECHCAHSAELQAAVGTCLGQNGNPCTQADLEKLGNIAQQICKVIGFVAAGNSTAAGSATTTHTLTGTNGAATGTATGITTNTNPGGTAVSPATSKPSPTATGAATRSLTAGVTSVWSGVLALILSALY